MALFQPKVKPVNRIGNSHWLAPWEQDAVIRALIESDADLVKCDNGRNLPLKSGGKTDIYMNLRNARNDPKIIALFTELYANPLSRLKVKRFGEVPDAVSCFAGPLSLKMNIPFTTIREQPKEGRVSKASVIGRLVRGERFALVDDVVTDGASKIAPARTCIAADVDLGPLVVLVDRQQGWLKKFGDEGLNLEVWSGMTLHDVRKFLISRGVMERCRKEVETKNPIIVALDGKPWSEVLPIADQLRTTGCILKVNDLLFWEGYRELIPDLQVYGRVMVDLKGHDIPNTLDNIAKRFATNPPWAVTVHASGGEAMIKAVVKAFEGTPTKVLTITVLTSMDAANSEEVYSRQPLEQVRKLAAIASRAGAHGLVCSPEEVATLKAEYPKLELITPGVRSPGAAQGDQARIGTPQATLALGASFLVMGRQILGAVDPVAEVQRLLKEEVKVS